MPLSKVKVPPDFPVFFTTEDSLIPSLPATFRIRPRPPRASINAIASPTAVIPSTAALRAGEKFDSAPEMDSITLPPFSIFEVIPPYVTSSSQPSPVSIAPMIATTVPKVAVIMAELNPP